MTIYAAGNKDPARCKHQNWYCVVGQPARCMDCGHVVKKPDDPPPPKLRIVK